MQLLSGPAAPDDQALEVAVAHALVRRAGAGELGATLRVYRPTRSVVAFGRRDTRLPGFADAAAACHEAGFAPVVRAPGGRAVAYTPAALVVDHVVPDPTVPEGMDRRFREFGRLYADVLSGLGVEAGVGEVPGEYCPGAHSVNARGKVKLVGTAQRIVRGAWLFSAVVVVDGAPVLRPLLTDVYRHLDQPFDPASVGSLRDELGGAAPDLDRLEALLLDAYASLEPLEPAALGSETLALARELAADHRAEDAVSGADRTGTPGHALRRPARS